MTPITIKLCDELLAKVREAVAQLPGPTQDDDWNQCWINWLGQFAMADRCLHDVKNDLAHFASLGARPNRIISGNHRKTVTNTESLLEEFKRAAAVTFDSHKLN